MREHAAARASSAPGDSSDGRYQRVNITQPHDRLEEQGAVGGQPVDRTSDGSMSDAAVRQTALSIHFELTVTVIIWIFFPARGDCMKTEIYLSDSTADSFAKYCKDNL